MIRAVAALALLLALGCAGPTGEVRGALTVDGTSLRPTACIVEPSGTVILVVGDPDLRDLRVHPDGRATLRVEKASALLTLPPSAHRRLDLGRCARLDVGASGEGRARFDCAALADEALSFRGRERGPDAPAPEVRVEGEVRLRACARGPVDGY